MKKKIVAGLTGGIATGKSLVLGQFKKCGAKVFDCDKIAREVVHASEEQYDRGELINMLEKEMLEAAEQLDFERAAMLRDRLKELQSAPTLETIAAGENDKQQMLWKPRAKHFRK